jgi:hypothetical protein
MEHQLKLHSESLQSRVEELEKENSELQKINKSQSEVNILKYIQYQLEINSNKKK